MPATHCTRCERSLPEADVWRLDEDGPTYCGRCAFIETDVPTTPEVWRWAASLLGAVNRDTDIPARSS